MSYLGQFDLSVVGWLGEKVLDWWDEQKVQKLVADFPAIFHQAKRDWAKFQAGLDNNLFTSKQRQEAIAWFSEFPQLWETIRPNYMDTAEGKEFGDRVDDFIGNILRSSEYKNRQLGIAPALIAGVLIVGGVAAALWAVSYIQDQNNLSKMIDGVTAGKIPPDVLKKKIEEAESGGLFGNAGEVLQWLAIAGAAWFILPQIFGKK